FKRKNAMDAGFQISLPHAHDIVSGHIWPPVKGRAAIALATSGNLSIPDEVQPWAPQDAMELHGTGGWILHTADRWVYETESTARHTLLATVRCLVPHLESLPEGRSLA